MLVYTCFACTGFCFLLAQSPWVCDVVRDDGGALGGALGGCVVVEQS